jgi:hypothetical protein
MDQLKLAPRGSDAEGHAIQAVRIAHAQIREALDRKSEAIVER